MRWKLFDRDKDPTEQGKEVPHVDSIDDSWDTEPDDVENKFSGLQPPSYTNIEHELVALSDDGRLATVGESYRQQSLNIVAAGKAFGTAFDEHGPVPVVLIPEPENPYDKHAVRVDVLLGTRSLHVSYLAREDARQYQPELLELRDQGRLGTCPGRLTGGGADRSYGIYLHLAPPHSIFAPPPIGVDASFARITAQEILLKPDWHCEVTGEERHQDVLPSHATPDGDSVRARLGFCTIARGKYAGERAIEVLIDGERVGQLTYAMTQRYAEIVDAVHARGSAAVCLAQVLESDRRGWQVYLSMPRDPALPPRDGY